MDSMLFIRRAMVWGLSFGIGLAITMAIIYGPMETDLYTYSIKYMVLTWIPVSMIFVVWADLFMGTKILND